jgi:tetratricopeptide (TPR) repeat protein
MQDFNKAISVNPKSPELHNSRGKAYFDAAMSGQFKDRQGEYVVKAIEDYTKGLSFDKIKPKNKAEMLINRGAAYASMNKFTEAVEDLSKGIELDPENKNGYFNRSLVYFSTNQYEKAIVDYTAYLKYDPQNANVWYERGMLKRSLGQHQEAISDLTNAIRFKPNFDVAYLERARAQIQSGNKAAAQQDYQRAQQLGVKLSPKDVEMMQ